MPTPFMGTTVVQNPAAQATTYNPARMDFDPKHDYDDVRQQVQGGCAEFVDNFVRSYPKGNPLEIMAYYDVNYLPALNTLARQFVICDRWFCSVPGPTWANRFFVNTGTSLGHVDMPSLAQFDPAWHNYNQPTIFERLSEAVPKISWRIYFHDFTQTALLSRQLPYGSNYRYMPSFYEDCKNAASFPQYAFLEPRYFWPGENDQHPDSDIRRGMRLSPTYTMRCWLTKNCGTKLCSSFSTTNTADFMITLMPVNRLIRPRQFLRTHTQRLRLIISPSIRLVHACPQCWFHLGSITVSCMASTITQVSCSTLRRSGDSQVWGIVYTRLTTLLTRSFGEWACDRTLQPLLPSRAFRKIPSPLG